MLAQKCKACGQKLNFLFEALGYKHFRCPNCGLVASAFNPPSGYFVKIYARDDYYKGGKTDWKPGYVDYAADEGPHRSYFGKKIARIKKLKPKGRLLDIGSALGFLLAEAKKEGYEVLGLDLSDYAVAFGKKNFGVEIKKIFFEDASFPKESFDIVTLIQTLEHIKDPQKFLAKIRDVLKKGGVLLIVTPNHESFWRKILGKYWFSYKPKEHLFYFTPKSLKALLEKAGFEIVSMRSDDPMGFRLERLLERYDYYWNLPFFKTLRRLSRQLGFGNISIPVWLDDLEVIVRKV